MMLSLLEGRNCRLAYIEERRDIGLAYVSPPPQRSEIIAKLLSIDIEQLAAVEAPGCGTVTQPKHLPASSLPYIPSSV